MPYQPVNVDWTHIPKWHAKYPDRHPRWISIDPNRLRGHMTDYGSGAYRQFGEGMTPEELREAVTELGLPEAVINTNLNRVMVGMNMLAWIPEDEFQRRVKERHAISRSKIDEAQEAYLASQTRKGVRPIVMEEEEFQDKKAFHSRESNNRTGYRKAQ